MTRFMLDTNTVAYLLRRHPQVVRRVQATPAERLCLSAVTEGELRYGLAKRPQATALHAAVGELLAAIEVLPWTGETARRYGATRAELERRGKPLGPLDLMIAAHALESEAALATSDRAFRSVPGLEVEDWTRG
jgi:tRNA(fMet)-specific endonuclease VapC